MKTLAISSLLLAMALAVAISLAIIEPCDKCDLYVVAPPKIGEKYEKIQFCHTELNTDDYTVLVYACSCGHKLWYCDKDRVVLRARDIWRFKAITAEFESKDGSKSYMECIAYQEDNISNWIVMSSNGKKIVSLPGYLPLPDTVNVKKTRLEQIHKKKN